MQGRILRLMHVGIYFATRLGPGHAQLFVAKAGNTTKLVTLDTFRVLGGKVGPPVNLGTVEP